MYEIILVDNASVDESKSIFSKDKSIIYIYNENNLGFGAANNIGMRVARGDYFFLLNSDTLLLNNAIKEFYNYSINNNNAIYGCYLTYLESKYTGSSFHFPAFTILQFIKRKFIDQNVKKNCIQEVDCISGADMFIPRYVIEKCGDFDENIFLYGEEGELQYRLMKNNIKRILIPYPQIVHLVGQSSKETLDKQIIKLKSHFYILKKHMRYPTYILARIFYFFNLGSRHINFLMNRDSLKYYKALCMQIKS